MQRRVFTQARVGDDEPGAHPLQRHDNSVETSSLLLSPVVSAIAPQLPNAMQQQASHFYDCSLS